MDNNLIPLTKEEAIAAMVVEDEQLVNDKETYDICHYKWDGKTIVSCDSYDIDSVETVKEFPQLYRRKQGSKPKTLLYEAVIFAALKHGNDKRKGIDLPYIYHPLEAMEILRDNGCSDNVLIAGVLHDTLEDTKTTEEEILNKFGKDVLNIVKAESEDKSKTWKERKQTTIEHLSNASLETKLVCCADKLANLRAMHFDQSVLGDKLWERFNASKKEIEWYYRGVASKLTKLSKYKMYNELVSLLDQVFVYEDD